MDDVPSRATSEQATDRTRALIAVMLAGLILTACSDETATDPQPSAISDYWLYEDVTIRRVGDDPPMSPLPGAAAALAEDDEPLLQHLTLASDILPSGTRTAIIGWSHYVARDTDVTITLTAWHGAGEPIVWSMLLEPTRGGQACVGATGELKRDGDGAFRFTPGLIPDVFERRWEYDDERCLAHDTSLLPMVDDPFWIELPDDDSLLLSSPQGEPHLFDRSPIGTE